MASLTSNLTLIDNFDGIPNGTALSGGGRGWGDDVFGDGSVLGYWNGRAASFDYSINPWGVSAYYAAASFPPIQRVAVTYADDYGVSTWAYKVVLYLRVLDAGTPYATGYRLVVYDDGTGWSDVWEIHYFYGGSEFEYYAVASGYSGFFLEPGDVVAFQADVGGNFYAYCNDDEWPILEGWDWSSEPDESTFGIGTTAEWVGLDDCYFGDPYAEPPVGDYLDAVAQLSGSGAFTPTPTVRLNAQATLSGAGALSPASTALVGAAVLLSGSGGLSLTPEAAYLDVVASIAGSGALQAHATALVSAASQLAGSGALQAHATALVSAASQLAGSGQLSPSAQLVSDAVAALIAGGQVEAAATLVLRAQAALAGAGTLHADPDLLSYAAVVLEGAGALVPKAVIGNAGVILPGRWRGHVRQADAGRVERASSWGRVLQPRAGRVTPG